MPVDYSKAKPESRKAFEFAFANLLRLQEMCVINYTAVSLSEILQWQKYICKLQRP